MRTYQISVDGAKQPEVFTSVSEACTRLRELRGSVVEQKPATLHPGSERTTYGQDRHAIEIVSADGTPLTDSDIAALVDGTTNHRR